MIAEERLAHVLESTKETTPIHVRKLGHVVFRVSDVERTTKFWMEIMGFQVSDRNEIGMVFLRHASDHHTIALAPAKEKSAVSAKEQVQGPDADRRHGGRDGNGEDPPGSPLGLEEGHRAPD